MPVSLNSERTSSIVRDIARKRTSARLSIHTCTLHIAINTRNAVYFDRYQVTKRKTPVSTFGQRLREERERLQMTQEQFAVLGGVKRVTQHLYELSERFPDVRYLESVLQHGADLQFLLLGNRQAAQHSADEVRLSGE